MATSVSPLTRSAPRRTGTAAAGLLTDGALARLVARGDDGAFEALYRRYERELYRYCRGITRHDEDAEEAFQHTMLNAYRALTKGGRDRELAVRPWLYRIAHNESISLLRGRRTAEELDERDDPVAGDLHERVEQRESLRELGRDLQSLSHRQRSALLLREMAGLSHEAVGAALETTPADARHLLHEARASLYEFRAGRDMACKEVERQILGGDRRQLRSRRVRAHLAGCEPCRDLSAAQLSRRRRIAAFDPVLPAGLAASVLGRVLGGSGASGAGAAGAASLAGSGVGAAGSGVLGGIGTAAIGGVAVVTMVAVTIGGLAGVDVGGASRPITPAGTTVATVTGPSADAARISSGPLAAIAPRAVAPPAVVADRAAAAADEPAGLPELLSGAALPAPEIAAAGAGPATPRAAVTPAVPVLPAIAPTAAPQVEAAAAGAVTVPDASDLVPPAMMPPTVPPASPAVEPPAAVERLRPKPPKPAPPQSSRPATPAVPARPATPARPALPDPVPARPAPPVAAPELPVGPPAGVPGVGPPPTVSPPGRPDAPPGSRGRGKGAATTP